MVAFISSNTETLWQKNIRGHAVSIKPVTSDNLDDAIAIAAQTYPNDLEKVAKFFSSATRKPEEWTLAQKDRVETLNGYMLYVDGKPAGVLGTQTNRYHPEILRANWSGMSYMYRSLGYSGVLNNFVRFQAEAKKQHVVSDVETSSGAENQTSSLLASLNDAALDYAAQKLAGDKSRKNFKRIYGHVSTYAEEGRLVDLTDAVAQQVRNPLTESFEKLNNQLFPVETERENVFADDGLKLYVQPDKTGKYEANERRILVMLDDDKKKVIGAMVYNISAVPADLRQKYGVDAVLGDTYLMTDSDYRANGIGGQLIKAAKQKSASFLEQKLGIKDPKIIFMTEQNDPMNMALQDSIKDFAGASVGPTERQSIWGRFGQQLIKGFNYTQVSLREGLESCQGLGLHVTMPDGQQEIPSDLLRYAVKSYADLALNKQQRQIEKDQDMIDMQEQLRIQPSFPLNSVVSEFVAKDNRLMAAQKMGALAGRGEESVGDLLEEYEAKVSAFKAPNPDLGFGLDKPHEPYKAPGATPQYRRDLIS